MPTIHLIVKGKVQGVFYRATAKEKADELGVTGWVQNIDDGNVEIMATAPQNVLDSFIQWCYDGPRRARVTNVTKEETEEQPFDGFAVRR